jgi:predicted ATPase
MGATSTIARPAVAPQRIQPGEDERHIRIVTPDQRLRIFVSSTLEELAAERRAARDAIETLHLTPVMFELGARAHPPRDLYRAYVAQSQVFIGLYWQRYGWIGPDMDISGLEDEYVISSAMPRLVYVKVPAPDREQRLEAMLEGMRASGAHCYKEFTTAEELHELVASDLALLLTERFQILEGQDSPVGASVSSQGDAPARWLPNAPTSIVGRQNELATIRELLSREDVRLLTLTGTGGTGKTRLAIEAVPSLADRFDLVHFVSLAAIRDPQLVASTIAQALGIRELGEKTPTECLKDLLRDKCALLVLDNFEQVADAASLVAELLAVCAHLKVLVTSRMPLELRGEHEFPVLPLAVPAGEAGNNLEVIATSPAVQLFLERAQAVRSDFSLKGDNASAVAEICRRLDGIPLAIELAAARVRVLSPVAMLARMERRLPLLTGGARDLPERQQTMRNTIAWSHSLLEEETAVLFRRLAAFAGGADLRAIEAVCYGSHPEHGGAFAQVEELVHKSLLRVAQGPGGEPRFSMLETIREYAGERLAESREERELLVRHAEFFLGMVVEAEPHLTSGRRFPYLVGLETDLDNLRAVIARSLDGRVPFEIGMDVCSHLLWYWYLRGRHIEGRRVSETMLQRLDKESDTVPRGSILLGAGALAWCQGDFVTARSFLEESVGVLRRVGTARDLAFPLTMIGATLASQQDYRGASAAYEESIAAARESRDQWTEAFASSWLGDIYLLTNDLDTARKLQEGSLDLFGRLGDDWGRAMVLHALAVVLGYLSEHQQARQMFEESARLMREANDQYALARVLSGAAELAVKEGDPDRAVTLLKEAISLWVHMGNETGLRLCVGIMAKIAGLRGEPEQAARLLGAAGPPLRTVGSLSAVGDPAVYEAEVEDLRSLLGEEAWSHEYESGRRMTIKDAVACALETGRLCAGAAPPRAG